MQERIIDGRVQVKPNRRWIMRARYVWEQANGPILKGYQIHHIDEDKMNDEISNLACLSVAEHCRISWKGKKRGESKLKGTHRTPEVRKKISDGHRGKKLSDEHKKNLSANHWSKKGDAEKIADKIAEKHHGIKQSDEQKKKRFAWRADEEKVKAHGLKVSKALKGRKCKIVTCPYCGKSGGESGMKCWHFNNCKKKTNHLEI